MTNEQAQGYVLLACKELGMSKEQAKKLLIVMSTDFDYYTEQEAEEKGFKWLYDDGANK